MDGRHGRRMDSLPSACVVGAGSSGIAAVKALAERGIPVECFEKSDRVGGNWVFANQNGMSSAYRSLHTNTSRERMAYSDFPMPREYPDFPHHTQMAQYFADYVDRFGLDRWITFKTGVSRAERGADGVWTVHLDTGETRHYDALLVANGHHWDAQWPEPAYPGSFDGVQMHSHHFVDASDFRDKAVLVVGMGNSAADIAVESSFVASRTFVSGRRGEHVIPKYIFGRPADQIAVSPLTPRVPFPVRHALFRAIYRVAVGRVEDYGLPKPDHRLLESHPTLSADFLGRVAQREVNFKPAVAALVGDRVRFVDGSEEPIDVIVWSTGYKITFPFFDEDFISAPDNELFLYRRVFKPRVDNLFFIALLQPLGPTMPIAEAQGRWIAAYLRGEYGLPSAAEMESEIRRERARLRRRYVASKRHTMEVDFDDYLYAVRRELKAGGRRARVAGFPLPVPARAQEVAPAAGQGA
jgi:flavin-binding monooxygenase-like protein